MKLVTCRTAVLFFGLSLLLGCTQRMNTMKLVRVDLGRNIVETARSSGISSYGVDDVNGSIQFSAVDLPDDLYVRFSRPGLEIQARSVFSVALVTDRKRMANEEVFLARIKMAASKLNSHSAARLHLNEILIQFAKGKWKRHIPEHCPAVTGRSTMLGLSGEFHSSTCPIDPSYRFSDTEYLALFKQTQEYQWMGDGVLATLAVDYSETGGILMYNFLLKFEDHRIMKKIEEEVAAWKRREGDAKGWNSTQQYEIGLVETAERNKILEQNAIARGDSVVPR
ncbi:hypothetical protein KY495_04250 [Massilia sp. PAMC28688]|uniref:hypothetical protein n=1 Tax=Massilia sp. PAMC28688 TaxID=2861283 RepID=UPI001C632311|nr:hypothetical protein [Massilia sp. PAMC28688]QYF94436.1 hypothetical protein KY495_04250 [Massilia sp. PAMC28688]